MRVALFIVSLYIALSTVAFSDSWDGPYAGLILGAQFGQSSDTTAAFGYNADNNEWDYNTSGFNAGAELGYNYSFNRLVVGPEFEFGALVVQGSAAQPLSPGLDTIGKSYSNLYTAFRGRIGFDLDHTLLFATGGAIGVNYNTQVIDSCNIAPCGGTTAIASKTSFVWGFTVGGGVEHMFEGSWSAKLEYLYFNLASQSFSGITNLGNTYDWTGKTSGNVIRGALNYFF